MQPIKVQSTLIINKNKTFCETESLTDKPAKLVYLAQGLTNHPTSWDDLLAFIKLALQV
jgi:hypothetical protein